MDQRRPTGQDQASLNSVIRLDGGMQTDEAAAQPPTTYRLVIGEMVVNYCLWLCRPEDGMTVVSHNRSPSTRFGVSW